MSALARIWDQYQEKRLTKTVLPRTLVGPERIHNLYVLARRIENERVPGDVVECGVHNGGTAAVLSHSVAHSNLERTVWLFDSFKDMPDITERDGDHAEE
jgi:O-methyltransferase